MRNKIELMKLRLVLPALMIGAGMLLPQLQPAAQAKTSYKHPKNNHYKVHKYKSKRPKFKTPKQARHKLR